VSLLSLGYRCDEALQRSNCVRTGAGWGFVREAVPIRTISRSGVPTIQSLRGSLDRMVGGAEIVTKTVRVRSLPSTRGASGRVAEVLLDVIVLVRSSYSARTAQDAPALPPGKRFRCVGRAMAGATLAMLLLSSGILEPVHFALLYLPLVVLAAPDDCEGTAVAGAASLRLLCHHLCPGQPGCSAIASQFGIAHHLCARRSRCASRQVSEAETCSRWDTRSDQGLPEMLISRSIPARSRRRPRSRCGR